MEYAWAGIDSKKSYPSSINLWPLAFETMIELVYGERDFLQVVSISAHASKERHFLLDHMYCFECFVFTFNNLLIVYPRKNKAGQGKGFCYAQINILDYMAGDLLIFYNTIHFERPLTLKSRMW